MMRRLACLALLVLLSGCAALDEMAAGGRGNVHQIDPAQFGPPDQLVPGQAVADYRIGPEDQLSVAILQLPDYPNAYVVDADGDIAMPLIGTVRAQGLTATELADVLKQKYSVRYLNAPQVQVAVTKALGDRVTIDGAVKEPGVYPLNGTHSLVQAIALAQGLDKSAIPSRVAVFRKIKGQRIAAAYNLTRIRKGLEPDPTVYGNDIIVVDGSRLGQTWTQLVQGVGLGALVR